MYLSEDVTYQTETVRSRSEILLDEVETALPSDSPTLRYGR